MNRRLHAAQTLLRFLLWPCASRSQVTSRRRTDAEVREFTFFNYTIVPPGSLFGICSF